MSEKELIPEIVSGDALQKITAAEVDLQVSTAKRYPRSIETFRREVKTLALMDRDIAGSCFYSIPRGGKVIEGPSIRFAEIVACSWGNLRAESRIVDVNKTHITAQSTVWDMEKNVLVRKEIGRKITHRDGGRYNEDMITMTGNAAASIALRNAVFTVVPFSHVKPLYEEAKRVSVGEGRTLIETRQAMLAFFVKVGVSEERVLKTLGRLSVNEITDGDVINLRGIATAIRDGESQADTIFPPEQLENGTHGFGKKNGQHGPPPQNESPTKWPSAQKLSLSEAKNAASIATMTEQLSALLNGETRKSVIDVINKRMNELAAAEMKELPHDPQTGEVLEEEPPPIADQNKFDW